MTSFKDMQHTVSELINRKEIFDYLVTHIEATFLPNSGAPAKKMLVPEGCVPVPATTIENVVQELAGQGKAIEDELKRIYATQFASVVPDDTSASDQEPRGEHGHPDESAQRNGGQHQPDDTADGEDGEEEGGETPQ